MYGGVTSPGNTKLASPHPPPTKKYTKITKNTKATEYDFKTMSTSTAVQLGFSEPYPPDTTNTNTNVFTNPNWNEWDGGKAGGKPIWLNPRDLPTDVLTCNQQHCCGVQMHFVCQLYCPLDDDDNDEAFHRALYVFACPKVKCRGVQILRCQLSKENDFYYSDHDNDYDGITTTTNVQPSINNKDDATNNWGVNMCSVCNQRAVGGICPTQNRYFCGRAHQKEHHKIVQKQTQKQLNDQDNIRNFSCMYDETEIVVEEEPQSAAAAKSDEEDVAKRLAKTTLFPTGVSDDVTTSTQDEDEDLEQEDLNRMTGSKGILHMNDDDPMLTQFWKRVNRADGSVKDQILRYNRWPFLKSNFKFSNDSDVDDKGGVLWTSAKDVPTANDIPACPHCGSERQFEFQILPQLLHHLGVERKAKRSNITQQAKEALLAAEQIQNNNSDSTGSTTMTDDNNLTSSNIEDISKKKHEEMVQRVRNSVFQQEGNMLDWGVISVYTCTKSCAAKGGDGSAYVQEFGWRQPPLSS